LKPNHYKLETHCHTEGVFICSNADPALIPPYFKKHGYGGVVITNHFTKNTIDHLGRTWTEKIDGYISFFKRAKEAGIKCGIKVFFGLELSLDDHYNDLLIYGLSPEMLYDIPNIFNYNYKDLFELANKENFLIYQAHPTRDYGGFIGANVVHGVEVYNGTKGRAGFVGNNEKALELAIKHNLKQISGSDFHCFDEVPTGGIYVADWVESERDLVEFLKKEQPELVKS
jgi:hypothetical protein